MTLPADWATCTLEDLLHPAPGAIVDGPFGSALKSSDYTSQGCRVIRLNNINVATFNDTDKAYVDARRFPELRRHEAQAGDILTAALGDPLGRSCLVPEDLGSAIVKADCFRSRLHPRVDAQLIMFWLNSPPLARYFSEHGKGVGRIRINLAVLRTAPLPLPPEDMQAALVERIRTVMARSENAKSEAQLALRAANALKVSGLKAGVTGQLTARWRETATDVESVDSLLERIPPPTQAPGGREATDTRMAGQAAIAVNDPGTPLPQGWRWTPLLRLARQETGHTPSRRHPEYWDGDVPWLGIRDARKHHGAVIDRTAQTITAAGLEGSSARMLPARTVCLSRTASVGYVTLLGRPMATSQDFVTWTCAPALIPEYLLYALMAEGKGIRRFGRGSTHTTIYFPELRALHIALPPLEEQQAITGRIKRLLYRADMLASEASRAMGLADDLVVRTITQAMSGALGAASSVSGASARSLLDDIAAERLTLEVQRKRSKPKRPPKSTSPTTLLYPDPFMTPDQITAAVREAGGSIRADALWKLSGLPIDIFYRRIRDELAAGRLTESSDKESLLAH
jgi:type I restriction enzyme S subunit